jgi:hypothetical protein
MTDANQAAVALMPRPTPDEAASRGLPPSRKAFLDEALARHLGPELRADLDGIVASYAKGGHLNFNGKVYDTAKGLIHFHREMGFDGQGVLGELTAEIAHLSYTHDSVIVEYLMHATITPKLKGGATGRRVDIATCGVYQFNEAGELASERIYLDTGLWLPTPVFSP